MFSGDYVRALLLTLFIEVPLYGLALRWVAGSGGAAAFKAGAAVNLVTHPAGFIALFPVVDRIAGSAWALASVELFAWTAETLMLWLWLRRDPLILAGAAFVANATSFVFGVLWLS